MEVGDRVKVKTWDALVTKYGLTKDGHILFPNKTVFLPMMRNFCGKRFYIEKIDQEIHWDKKPAYYLTGCSTWLFPEESLIKLK